MGLEFIGKMLTAGYGDRVLIGILMGLWDNVSPDRAYEYIRDDLKLGQWIAEEDWRKYRKLAKDANIGDITTERVITELRNRHPDILGVIINNPKGREWLDRQITEIKGKLGVA